MRPTRAGVLLAVGLLAATVTWGLLRILDSRSPLTPPMPWTVPVALLFLALGIAVSAVSLSGRLRGDLDARPVDPLAAARMVALAKASSHAGALLAGGYAGVAAFLLPDAEGDLRRERLLLAGTSVLCALVLLGAGLFLERVCRVEPPDDEHALPSAP